MPSWLITGASRGLGFAIVEELICSKENIVFATCRNPEEARSLRSLSESPSKTGSFYIIELDVTDEASVFMAQREIESTLGTRGLDFLINNASVAPRDDLPSTMDITDLVTTVETNVGGPALVTRMFIPLLERGERKVTVNISSTLGSIGMEQGPRHTAYSISKMALSMLTYKQMKERPDIITFALHPGWSKKDVVGEDAVLQLKDCARRVLRVVREAKPDYSGKFFDGEGNIVLW